MHILNRSEIMSNWQMFWHKILTFQGHMFHIHRHCIYKNGKIKKLPLQDRQQKHVSCTALVMKIRVVQIEYGSVLARRVNRVFLVICGSVLAHCVNRVIFRSDWRHTVLAHHATRHATQQNVVGESKNMKHVKKIKIIIFNINHRKNYYFSWNCRFFRNT